jgi:large subunit ribosomal protein L31
MKKGIHPTYKKLRLEIGKEVFETFSTYPGEKILVETDFRKHIAWDKSAKMSANESNKSVSAFNKKFSGISFGIKK